MGLVIGAQYLLRKPQIFGSQGRIVNTSKARRNNGGVVASLSSQDQECFKLERHRHPKGHPYT